MDSNKERRTCTKTQIHLRLSIRSVLTRVQGMMSSYITWRTFDKCQRLCDFYQIIPYYSEQYNNLFPCLTEDHLVYIAYTLWLYII